VNYLLDTSICVQIMSEKFRKQHERLIATSLSASLYISTVVLFELEYGNAKSQVPLKSGLRLRRLLSEPIEVLPFNEGDAVSAGSVRAMLEARKQPIGPYDTLIAGQALARGLTLVTANQREFARVDGLLWEDWA
jgi:tRNA(fMet)-specific endonuclease VapC